jgi:Lrp/AsnC family transcriptional regulator for asnA, asnC and gidA
VAIASGRYDLLVEVHVASNHGLVDWLTKTLPTVPGLTRTETFLMLRTVDKFI